MGIPRPPDRALLFVGVLFSKKDYYIKVMATRMKIQIIKKIFHLNLIGKLILIIH